MSINNIESKLKINNSEIVPVDKYKTIVIAYIKDLHYKTSGYINNNNIQTLKSDPTVLYIKKKINNITKYSKEIIPKNQK